jgi:hypothetical protein
MSGQLYQTAPLQSRKWPGLLEREAELATLGRAVEETATGRGSVVLGPRTRYGPPPASSVRSSWLPSARGAS